MIRRRNSINSFYWSLETIGRCHVVPFLVLFVFTQAETMLRYSLQFITQRWVWMKNEPDSMAESVLSAINFVCTSNESHRYLMQFMQFDVNGGGGKSFTFLSNFSPPDQFVFNYRLVKLCWKSAERGGVFLLFFFWAKAFNVFSYSFKRHCSR